MPDEEQQIPAENEIVEAENHEPSSPDDEQQAPQMEETPEAPASATDSDDEKRPSRAERRIRQLSEQLREAQAPKQLEVAEPQPYQLPWEAPQDPWTQYENGEISIQQLRDLTVTTADQQAQLRVQQLEQKLRAEREEEQFWNSFEQDVKSVEARNSRFNPESPDYDEGYTKEISELYLEAFQANPKQAPKLSTFVERIERLRNQAQEQGRSQTTATLAQQVAEGALTPSNGGRSEDRPFEQLSRAEMEAKLGFVS